MITFQIPKILDAERLDKALTILTNLNRSKIIEAIDANLVTVNTKVITTKSFRLKQNDVVTVEVALIDTATVISANPEIRFDIKYEDEDILVIDKPSNLAVHPRSLESTGELANTLVSGIIAYDPNIATVGESFRPGIVHRLDKDTTGLMVIAKNNRAFDLLKFAVKNHLIERRYLAVALGVFSDRSVKIEAPIGRSLSDRRKMAVVESGKSAVTRFKVIESFNKHLKCSLLEVTIETGRTHQIRVHLSELGHPILGDKLYNGNIKNFPHAPTRPLLHAFSLKFKHPISDTTLNIKSNIPEDFATTLEILSR